MAIYCLEYVNRDGDLEVIRFSLSGQRVSTFIPAQSSADYEFPDSKTIYLTKEVKDEGEGMSWYAKLGEMRGLADESGELTSYEFVENITEDDEAFEEFVTNITPTITELEETYGEVLNGTV